MKNIHVQNSSDNPSAKQSNEQHVWEQMDLFEWAGRYDESCVGFAARNGL
jgi:hypothetical protein